MWLTIFYQILFNPISVIVWFIAIITFLMPRQYLGLYIWILTILLTLTWASIRTPEIEEGISTSLAREFIFLDMKGVVLCMILRITITFIKIIISNKNNQNNRNQLTEIKLFSKITLIAYGFLIAGCLYLFFTDFLENYQPAWEAYSIVLITTLFIFGFVYLIQNNRKFQRYIWIKNLHFLSYSFCLAMMPLVIISLSFSLIARKETNKIVRQYEKQQIRYCIQGLEMQTWLDLTPLTTWNKSTGDPRSPSGNHAVLVIQSSSATDLYNWSYRLRRWEYITSGFAPPSFSTPSSLECVLDNNYAKKLPFLIPKPLQVHIGNKKLNIPYEYFSKQEQYSLSKDSHNKKTINFLASTRDFSSIR